MRKSHKTICCFCFKVHVESSQFQDFILILNNGKIVQLSGDDQTKAKVSKDVQVHSFPISLYK